MAMLYSVGDHCHYEIRGVRHCAVVVEVDPPKLYSQLYTLQGRHPDNRDCEWAMEGEAHMWVLAQDWLDGS